MHNRRAYACGITQTIKKIIPLTEFNISLGLAREQPNTKTLLIFAEADVSFLADMLHWAAGWLEDQGVKDQALVRNTARGYELFYEIKENENENDPNSDPAGTPETEA